MRFAYLIEPPFNYRNASGSVTGCDVELALLVLAELGVINCELVETEFAELLSGLADGRWRMTTGLFCTEERQKIAAFSRPIWTLPDGLLVRRGNPLGLDGYKSVASNNHCKIAVVRDQFQHRSAVDFGTPEERVLVFATYAEAANAVKNCQADAYASVARAHTGFLNEHPDFECETIPVPSFEKRPAFGSFALALNDDGFRHSVDEALAGFLGTQTHRNLMARFGFTPEEVDAVI